MILMPIAEALKRLMQILVMCLRTEVLWQTGVSFIRIISINSYISIIPYSYQLKFRYNKS